MDSPFTSNLKVALVKQSSYCDLYTDPSTRDPKQLLASSIHRTGPIGLFTNFDSTFIIVLPEPDPECRVWEEKLTYEEAGSARSIRFPKLRAQQASVAVRADSVDWSQFDLVVAIENAVPARLTREHPGVLWCTLLEHHKLAPYRDYLRKPPPGYDAFLSLRFGPNPQSLGRRPHVIEFPYGLNDVSGLAGLYGKPDTAPRVMLEDHQDAASIGPLLERAGIDWCQFRESAGSLADYHSMMAASTVFMSPRSNRPLGGLASIDAAAMDCLVIGNRRDYWNPFIILPELNVASVPDALRVLGKLNNGQSLGARLLAKQRRRLHWFAWVRPLFQIRAFAEQAGRKLSILEKRAA